MYWVVASDATQARRAKVNLAVVGKPGLEPGRLSAHDPKSEKLALESPSTPGPLYLVVSVADRLCFRVGIKIGIKS